MTFKTFSLVYIFMKIIHVFNLSINMILDNDNGLWQLTLWNNEYDTDLAVKLSNMSEVYCAFSANLQVYLQ